MHFTRRKEEGEHFIEAWYGERSVGFLMYENDPEERSAYLSEIDVPIVQDRRKGIGSRL